MPPSDSIHDEWDDLELLDFQGVVVVAGRADEMKRDAAKMSTAVHSSSDMQEISFNSPDDYDPTEGRPAAHL